MDAFDAQDTKFMSIALDLAKKGAGYALPNPMVGAIIAKNGHIFGQGFHEKFGSDHAEVNALREAGKDAEDATLYVTLEPCVHFGKTPPCVDRIVDAQIKRVVVAMQDPNPLIAGKGIEKLRAQGVQVQVGLLEAEAVALNRPFIKFITTKQPYVTLKIAQTLDGRIADHRGSSRWITGQEARKRVHQWRFEAGAVLVGIGTVLADNPRLTVRHAEGKQPFRIVLDSDLRIPLDSPVLSEDLINKTIVFAKKSKYTEKRKETILARGARVVQISSTNTGLSIPEILTTLGELGIAHIFVEGGAAVFSSFLKEQCADHLCLFIAEKIFGDGKTSINFSGLNSDCPLNFKNTVWRKIGDDMLFEADF